MFFAAHATTHAPLHATTFGDAKEEIKQHLSATSDNPLRLEHTTVCKEKKKIKLDIVFF